VLDSRKRQKSHFSIQRHWGSSGILFNVYRKGFHGRGAGWKGGRCMMLTARYLAARLGTRGAVVPFPCTSSSSDASLGIEKHFVFVLPKEIHKACVYWYYSDIRLLNIS
jgi:hypothetical protein